MNSNDTDSGEFLLDQSEGLDSDEVRNDDGDEVVDPPTHWIPAEEHDSLAEKLAAETPDVSPWDGPSFASEDDEGERDVILMSDDQLDRLDLDQHGVARGQVSGAPEDGESFFDVAD